MMAVLIQEAEWYDTQKLDELPIEINDHIAQIESVSGKGSSVFLFTIGVSFMSIPVSFYIAPLLSIPLLSAWIYLLFVGGFQAKIVAKSEVSCIPCLSSIDLERRQRILQEVRSGC